MFTAARARLSACFTVLLVFATTSYSQTAVFGPKTFLVTAGQPQSFSDAFSANLGDDCDGKARYVLRIQNGNSQLNDGAAAARIALNGLVLLTEDDFRATSGVREVPVVLTATNQLDIEIAGGKRGGPLTVTITGEIHGVVWHQGANAGTTRSSSSFDVEDPSGTYLVSVFNGDGRGLKRVSACSIAVNGVDVINEPEFTQRTASVRRIVTLQSHNTISLSVRGAPGTYVAIDVERLLDENACGPRVQIDTPAEGQAIITSSDVEVTGTLISPSDAGVSVNDTIAEVNFAHAGTMSDPFRWYAFVPAIAGPMALEAVGTDERGHQGRAKRVVDVTLTPSSLWFTPDFAAGVAPFAATFMVRSDVTASPIKTYDIDFDSDGRWEIAGAESLPDPLTHVYAAPGVYRARLRAVYEDATSTTADTAVVVQTFGAIDAVVQRRWQHLRDAFAARDVEAAGQLFMPAARAKYVEAFTTLRERLPSIAAGMPDSPAGATELTAYSADYVVFRTEEGVTRSYSLSLVRDANGVWKIADF